MTVLAAASLRSLAQLKWMATGYWHYLHKQHNIHNSPFCHFCHFCPDLPGFLSTGTDVTEVRKGRKVPAVTISTDKSQWPVNLRSVGCVFGHCSTPRYKIKRVSMSAMIGVMLSVLVSAGALGAEAPGRSQHKSPTTRTSKVIAYAKQLDVSHLDSTLPKQPLEGWMRDSGAPASATGWVLSDCDLKDPAPPAPLCVKFEVRQGRGSIVGLIEVGTQRDGVTGQPRFLGMGLTIGLAEYLESADNLSELPRLITRAKQPKH